MKLRKATRPYTSIANDALRDPNLSLRAKGLLALLLSLPDDWTFRLDWIVQQSKEGRDATRAALRELREAGYIKTVPARSAGGHFAGHDWMIADTPLKEIESERTELLETRRSEKPEDGNPVAHTKKEGTNKDFTKLHSVPTTTDNPTGAVDMRSLEAQKRKQTYLETRDRSGKVHLVLGAELTARLTELHTRLNRRDSRRAHQQWEAHVLHPKLEALGAATFRDTLAEALAKVEGNPMIQNPYAFIAKQLERATTAASKPQEAPATSEADFIRALMEV